MAQVTRIKVSFHIRETTVLFLFICVKLLGGEEQKAYRPSEGEHCSSIGGICRINLHFVAVAGRLKAQ